MNREETKQLVRVICGIYPTFKPQNMSDTVDAWTWALEDFKYSDIQLALKTYQRTSGSAFAPSTAELIAMINKPKQLNTLSEGEAWALVKKAIKNGNYGSQEEYDKLPPIVQKAVGGAGMIKEWASCDSDEVNTVIMSNFQRSYRILAQRELEKDALPLELKQALGWEERIGIE